MIAIMIAIDDEKMKEHTKAMIGKMNIPIAAIRTVIVEEII